MARVAPWIAAFLIVAGLAGYIYWWQASQYGPAETPPVAQSAAPPLPPQEKPPAIEHPIEQARPEGDAGDAPGATPDATLVGTLVTELVGSAGARQFLRVDDFIRRVVVTVDTLPRENGVPRLWPVTTTPGRFETERRNDQDVIAARNARRYEPFVRFVEAIDTGRAVALYVRLYPLFQQAYRDLGYPDRHFNDRLVAVIDHLLATPDVAEAPAVVQRKVFLEYVDDALQDRSYGQRTLIRMGPANAARLKAKLRDARRQLTRAPAG